MARSRSPEAFHEVADLGDLLGLGDQRLLGRDRVGAGLLAGGLRPRRLARRRRRARASSAGRRGRRGRRSTAAVGSCSFIAGACVRVVRRVAAAGLEPLLEQVDLGGEVLVAAHVELQPGLGVAGLPRPDLALAVGGLDEDGAVVVDPSPLRLRAHARALNTMRAHPRCAATSLLNVIVAVCVLPDAAGAGARGGRGRGGRTRRCCARAVPRRDHPRSRAPGAGMVVLVGTGSAAPAYAARRRGTFAGFGVAARGRRWARRARPGRAAAGARRSAPGSSRRARPDPVRRPVGADAARRPTLPARPRRRAARHGRRQRAAHRKAPGYLDERAAGFDAAVRGRAGAGDPAQLAALDAGARRRAARRRRPGLARGGRTARPARYAAERALRPATRTASATSSPLDGS